MVCSRKIKEWIIINNVNLVGRLTKYPELKFTVGTGTAVANFTLAVDRRFSKNKEVDFINIVCFGKTAEVVSEYSGKGKLLGVTGRIQVRSYDAKDGTKKYVTEVIGENIDIIEWNKRENNENQKKGYQPF